MRPPAALLVALACLAAAGCGGQRLARPWAGRSTPAADPAAARVEEARRRLDDGLVAEARALIEELVAAGSEHPLLPYLRAQVAEHDEDWPACIAWARRAIAASPSWGAPRVLLARACLAAGRVDEADAAFADVERLLPDSPWGPYGRAWVAAQRLELAQAAQLAEEALRREADHLPSLQLRAQIARLRGERELEERLLRRALQLAPPAAPLLVRLGELAEAAGRMSDARRAYERAWELQPAPELARRLLDLARAAGDAEAAARWQPWAP